MSEFIDDLIEHREDDIEKIQTKPNMYISYLGSKGSLHLSKEVINNAIDESINLNSPCDKINIYLDENDNSLVVADNGRGIQFESLEIVCTKLQAGSKFTREGGGKGSAGENGCGLTAVNALSDNFEIISTRYGERAIIKFSQGKLLHSVSKKKINEDTHGTTVRFNPNPFYMGDDCSIPTDLLIEWIEKIIYLVPSNTELILSVSRKGKESAINKKYRNKNGLKDYILKMCKKPILDPIHFMKSIKINEFYKGREIERFIGLEVAFTFMSSTETIIDSFCNFVNTIEGGVHNDAIKQGITQFIIRKTKENMSEKELKNIDILPSDIGQGLVLTLYLSTDMSTEFTGQTKEKLSNSAFFKPLRNMTFNALDEYFKTNTKELKKITDFVKINAKVRIESAKVRNLVTLEKTTSYEEHTMPNFVPANNTGNNYRELFLIEGISSKGTARAGRDTFTQALFALRGVPLNTFNLKLDKILLNEEFLGLVKILKCNIGDRFNITKLNYNKIIMLFDADIDGFRIASLICVFFLCHMPEIIRRGLLYKAVSPLYLLSDTKKHFILDKKEYINVFEKTVRQNIKAVDPMTNIVLTNDEMKELLLKNRGYLEELHRVANHFAVHPFIIELLSIYGDKPNFMSKIKKKFPELSLDDENVLSGIYNGKYQIIILDEIFEKRIANLRNLIRNVNSNKVYYIINEFHNKLNINLGLMTLGEFLTLCQKYQPNITTRFKGLGELNASDLWETTMNPNTRTLIQLTMFDVIKELEKFKILHGSGDIPARKELMHNFKISREDLDN